MTFSVHWLPAQPIRESRLRGSMGQARARAFEDTHWHESMAPSLPSPLDCDISPLATSEDSVTGNKNTQDTEHR